MANQPQIPFAAVGRTAGSAFKTHPELPTILALIMLVNVPVVFFGGAPELMYSTAAVLGGEWWRLITHPFVHVSWYHFLLDFLAFAVLYHGLQANRITRRLGYVLWTACGSLIAAIAWAPVIKQIGFCGLSGVGHGLMAITGMEMAASRDQSRLIRRLGDATVVIVVVKCLWELIAGGSAVGFLHFGLMGTPIVVCHAGGVVAGILAFYCLGFRDRERHSDDCLPNLNHEFEALPVTPTHPDPPTSMRGGANDLRVHGEQQRSLSRR